MKKTAFIAFFSLAGLTSLLAQSDSSRGKNHTVSFGLNIPVGVFSETHIAGIGASYLWSDHRFGKLGRLPSKWIGFTANIGVDYYLGKKETVAGYEVKYGGYLYVHLFGGIIYNPAKSVNLRLTTGPTMGLYKGVADIGLGADLSGSYYINDKVSLGPGLMYMKHDQAQALWTVMVRGAISF